MTKLVDLTSLLDPTDLATMPERVPFHVMARAFQETGDPGQIWDGHFAGREQEVFRTHADAPVAGRPI